MGILMLPRGEREVIIHHSLDADTASLEEIAQPGLRWEESHGGG